MKFATLASILLVSSVQAHVALWDKGMYGYNYPDVGGSATQNYNTNQPVIPLKAADKLTWGQWFGHGFINLPPKTGDFMELPSGGTYKGELACNRADSKLRDPRRTDAQPKFACSGEGALHVVNNLMNSTKPLNITWFGGTALAIAYTSDPTSIKPIDMTVISVNTASPWYRNTDYQIPAGMPACPAGGCICTWNWIHRANNGEGYPYEIYNNMYRCKITNPGTGKVVGKPQPAKLCAGNTAGCVKGPKQPNYVWMVNGNNQEWTEEPPTYNSRYGFAEGAQNDIFATAAASSTSKASSSSIKPSTTTSISKAATSSVKPTTTSKAAATTSVKAKRHVPPMGMNRIRAHSRDFVRARLAID